MYTKGFWIILASCGQIGSKVVWGKCGAPANYRVVHLVILEYKSRYSIKIICFAYLKRGLLFNDHLTGFFGYVSCLRCCCSGERSLTDQMAERLNPKE